MKWEDVTTNDMHECLESCFGVDEETIRIAVNGWGDNQDTAETILFAVSEWRTFDQPDHDLSCPLYWLEEDEDEDDEDY